MSIDIEDKIRRLKNGELEIASRKESMAPPRQVGEFISFLSDGTLALSIDHTTEPLVLDYLTNLDRKQVHYELHTANLAEVHRLNECIVQEYQETGTEAQRQEQVVSIIKSATQQKASDVHVVVDRSYCRVMIRVNGELHPFRQMSHGEGMALIRSTYQTMSDSGDESLRINESQDARLKTEWVSRVGLFGARVATRPLGTSGLMMILRLLYDHGNDAKTINDLGYLKSQNESIERFTHLSHGIVIYSGPTGSGKSTAMAVSLESLGRFFDYRLHILTIENPPEYRISCANQTPLNYQGDWAEDIRNAMRLDPDVMMIGEIRDLDSCTAAFRAAMTGHGIWTTVHANDTTSVIDRLSDLGVNRSLLLDPSLVRGVVNQNLVQQVCPRCSLRFDQVCQDIPDDLISRIRRYTQVQATRYRNPDGCSTCQNTGIAGRLPVAEILETDLRFFDVYSDQGKIRARQYWVKELGGVTKNMHLIKLIDSGLVDPISAERSVAPIDDDMRTLGLDPRLMLIERGLCDPVRDEEHPVATASAEVLS
ncbi:ATPase, T2SS/T4P/T4SS family [Halomonas elongata]|uniref:GspE/PulE family protein n=1 Tax=Halomonas elongata TaxID=2746 RepID=UPI00255A9EFE|nr:ATPase, T2SS/T4P/T4SS family [Halomonas elongata]MDL4860762.1 ATPase, T2SS/T4P/T4SS family [Halomonas elongata]